MTKSKIISLKYIKNISLVLLAALFLSGFALVIANNQSQVFAQKEESGPTTDGVLLCNGEDNSYKLSIATYNNCTVSYNSSPTLSWNIVSVDGWVSVDDCELTGADGYSVPGKTGSVSVGPLTSYQTYSVECWDGRGSYSMVASLAITVTAAPTGNITCNGAASCTILYNTSATIAWSSENASSCTITNGSDTAWSGTSGSESTGNLTTTTTYTLGCWPDPEGARIPIESVTVTVQPLGDFTLSCAPPSASISLGSSTSFILTVNRSGGFTDEVSFGDPSIEPSGKEVVAPVHTWALGGFSDEDTATSNITSSSETALGDYTITYYASGSGINRECTVYLSIGATPTGAITCNGLDAECTIDYNTSATIAWSSENASSCTITNGSDTAWSGTSGSESTGNLTTTTTYTLGCWPDPEGARIPIESVTVTVSADYSMSCSPITQTISAGTDTSFIISSIPYNGFNEGLTLEYIMDPIPFNPLNGPSVSFSPSDQMKPGEDAVAVITTTEDTPGGTYTLTFGGSWTIGVDGYTTLRQCEAVQLIVNGLPPVPPENVTVDNQEQCGAIDISWTRGVGTNPEGYRVYRYGDGDGGGAIWTQLSADIPYGDVQYTSDGVNYTYRDNNPLEPGSNYYTVVSYNFGTESDYDPNPTGIIPIACEADLSLSDIDVLSVVGNISKTFSPSDCSGQSEVASLPNNGLFSQGDSIEFQMNICSSGELDVTNPVVELILNNLINLSIIESSPKGCVIDQTENKSGGMQFVLDNLLDQGTGNPVACSIVFTANIENSATLTNQTRFQATANITSDQVNTQIYTPPYLVGRVVGTPNRGEVAP